MLGRHAQPSAWVKVYFEDMYDILASAQQVCCVTVTIMKGKTYSILYNFDGLFNVVRLPVSLNP
jgi:hypothetical protein